MTPVICIVGKSKSGKTKLMEALIKELKGKGLRIGALKYHKHGDFDMDIEGKDTWKYAGAGADTVAISSPVKCAVIKKLDKEMGIDEICEHFKDCDVVLADGFTKSDKARIIVADSGEDIEIFERGCEVLAVVGAEGFDAVAVVEKVVDFLSG